MVLQCPLCGRSAAPLPLPPLQSSRGKAFPRSRCTHCGCEWLNPQPDAAQLAEAYSTDYYGEGASKFAAPVESVINWFRSGRARSAARFLGSSRAAVLDIGCGNGGFLKSLGRLGGFALHGVELPGPAADRASRIPGLFVHIGPFSENSLPVRQFRLITLFHVIEHLPEPGALLDSTARLLEPGGRLRISLPNVSSWQAAWSGQAWLHWDPPRHLWLAPPSALRARAEGAGLRLVRENHFSLEQNPFGLLQGLLNRFLPRDRLYDWLKRKAPEGRQQPTPWLDLLLAALLAIPCLLATLLESLVSKGGTIELDFEKPHGPRLHACFNSENLPTDACIREKK